MLSKIRLVAAWLFDQVILPLLITFGSKNAAATRARRAKKET